MPCTFQSSSIYLKFSKWLLKRVEQKFWMEPCTSTLKNNYKDFWIDNNCDCNSVNLPQLNPTVCKSHQNSRRTRALKMSLPPSTPNLTPWTHFNWTRKRATLSALVQFTLLYSTLLPSPFEKNRDCGNCVTSLMNYPTVEGQKHL